jgi:peptide-methionine (S)-S-oxide reductase
MRHNWTWLTLSSVVAVAFVLWAKGMVGIPATSDDFRRLAPASSGPPPAGSEQATFGAGCFWCTEAVFQQLNGVLAVQPGYSGGSVKNPTYEQVCRGTTGHAEVIQVTFDPKVISYRELLEVFWKTHDPTTRNRQGNDRGLQYRSAIFYLTLEQRELAEMYKQKLNEAGAFAAPIVTEIVPFAEFYPAESYHQNYYLDNSRQPYCSVIIRPKLEKFQKVFQDKLRSKSK